MADEFTSRHIEGPDTGAGMVGDASGMMRYVKGCARRDDGRRSGRARPAGRRKFYVTLANGEVVRAAERARRRFAGDDTLVVFPPIEGG